MFLYGIIIATSEDGPFCILNILFPLLGYTCIHVRLIVMKCLLLSEYI